MTHYHTPVDLALIISSRVLERAVLNGTIQEITEANDLVTNVKLLVEVHAKIIAMVERGEQP